MVSAIASIEEQEDPNDTDPQDPNYDPNDDIENTEVTERKFDVKYAEDTGKSLSEALILASVNPQYDKRLFIELQGQYMKIACSESEHALCIIDAVGSWQIILPMPNLEGPY